MSQPSPRRSSGFTLLEMLVATVLASVVLLGIFNLAANMVKSQVRNTRGGTTAAWSLAGMNALSTDIAGASQLSYPASGGSADYLIVCSNYSAKMGSGGGAVMSAVAPVTSQQYCWDTADPAPFGNSILRMTGGSCPTSPVVPCTTANYGNNVMASGVYHDTANDPIFYADPKMTNAVRLRLNIGNPTGNASSAGSGGAVMGSAVTVPFNTEIILED